METRTRTLTAQEIINILDARAYNMGVSLDELPVYIEDNGGNTYRIADCHTRNIVDVERNPVEGVVISALFTY